MLELMQWPAMLTALIGSWYISSDKPKHRVFGFYNFMIANICWIAWGIGDHAMGIIAMQAFYLITSVRGILKNKASEIGKRK